MQTKATRLPDHAVWEHFNGSGHDAHFYHANGFPVKAYSPLLTRLGQKFNLRALHSRPTWPGVGLPPKRRDWQMYADDLISFIEHECDGPIIGIGHSIGATCTVLAAQKRPDLFKALVLMEPAMVSRPLAWLMRALPKPIINLTDPAKSTLRKTDTWNSREEFGAHVRAFGGYRRFDEDTYQALEQHGVQERQDGRFQLTFPKIWEAHNYTQPPNVMDSLGDLKIPCVGIRGKPSLFFSDALWQEWRRRSPNTVFEENLSAGHLLPLEKPESCFQLIGKGLSRIL